MTPTADHKPLIERIDAAIKKVNQTYPVHESSCNILDYSMRGELYKLLTDCRAALESEKTSPPKLQHRGIEPGELGERAQSIINRIKLSIEFTKPDEYEEVVYVIEGLLKENRKLTSVYKQAVQGRRDFRASYKQERENNKVLHDELGRKEAELEKLKSQKECLLGGYRGMADVVMRMIDMYDERFPNDPANFDPEGVSDAEPKE